MTDRWWRVKRELPSESVNSKPRPDRFHMSHSANSVAVTVLSKQGPVASGRMRT